MTIVGAGEVPITPTFPGFRGDVLDQINTSAAEAGGRFKEAFGRAVKGIGVGIAAGVAAATASVAAIGAKGLDRALNIQDAKAQLTGLGHSAESVGTIMESALASVKGTAFGLDQSAQIAASSVAAGIAPGEALTRVLKLTADSATIAKAPLSEMGSIINKVATNQRLTTETMQQFQDRGIPILQAVAEQFGVTADEAAKMVSEGKVDFASFQAALESSVGGAALSSGTTARGALANIGAAFSRLGAMFVQSGVDGAPTLFTSIANAVDRAAEALKPYAAAFSERLAPAMAALSGYIDSIDFGRIIGGIEGVYALIVQGDFTTKFREAFNLEEDSTVVNRILRIRDGISGLYSLIVQGDFTSALRNAFHLEEDSGFVTFILGARDAVRSFFSSFTQGDFGGAFASIGTSMQTLQPAFASFGAELPKIGQAMSQVVAGGVTVLTQVLSFLADNVDTIVQLMPLIVAGFFAWRVASTAVANATLALRAGELAAAPVYFANNIMRNNSVRIERQLALAKATATGSTATNTAATNANTAATARGRIATIAANAASRVAAAGQWLLNAALSANPIGIIIAAIVALVAGLVWFFTQTELGQAIWGEFTRFLGEAWANIVSVATTVWTALASFFTDLWNGIVGVVTSVWNGITSFLGPVFDFIATLIRVYVETWINIILVMAAVLVTIWNGIVAVVTTVWNAIVSFLTPIVEFIVGLVVGYFTGLWTFWTTVWTAVVEFFTGMWSGLLAFLVPIIATVIGAVQGPVQALSDWWNGVWSTISGFFAGIWNGMVGAVSTAIGQIGGFVGGIFDIVMGALGNAGEWLLNAGGDVVRGFWEGISGMGDWLFQQIGGFFDGVIGWAKDTLGIQSPSRVFRAEVGQMVGEGMALGVTDSTTVVQRAMVALTAVPPAAPRPAFDADARQGGGGAGETVAPVEVNVYGSSDPVETGQVAAHTVGQLIGKRGG
ncbi:tape measure domain-containing protein [Microbacterium hydrothermale]|uniref:tape measure protein n=1 Tax=Microbacterium hydrothermale TaxID=857427 RepID=UPI00222795CB|nr:tape measure protein [Microbacterium hydrothermale]MCW2165064.1 tape measure domain-containing protein [Microbacterium hydrothermale]